MSYIIRSEESLYTSNPGIDSSPSLDVSTSSKLEQEQGGETYVTECREMSGGTTYGAHKLV